MFKEKLSSKKFPKVGIIICCILLSIILILLIRSEEPDCTDRDHGSGWDCRYSADAFIIPKLVDTKYRWKCKKHGGRYYSMADTIELAKSSAWGNQEEGPYFYCSKPFPDYKEVCNSSDDCLGHCEYVGYIPSYCKKNGNHNEYVCTKDIVGRCSADYRLPGTTYSVEGNKIKEFTWQE